MNFKKRRSPPEDFGKAISVLFNVKKLMLEEYKAKRVIVNKLIEKKMQKRKVIS